MVGLPHTPFDKVAASSCAFTAKAVRTVEMWRKSGHQVTVYWGGDGDVPCLTLEEQQQWFGPWDPAELPKVGWDATLDYWQRFHARAIQAISERITPTDLIAGLVGSIHQQVFDAFPNHTRIEPGVGYEGLARDTFACFESYSWMHNRYGALGIGDGRFFDTVIPNACDPADWEAWGEDRHYALFAGRCIGRKGPHLAAQIAKRYGIPLKIAGAGVVSAEPGRIVCADGTIIEGDHVEYVGAVTGQERRELFAHASFMLMPTLYLEPFGNSHIEAMMSNVGVVVPDFGVFTETVRPQTRFRDMAGAVEACDHARATRHCGWRLDALKIADPDRCRRLYDKWFDRLANLRNGRNGFYA